MDDVIHSCMAWVSSLAPPATEAIGAKTVHLRSTVAALVWSAKRGAKSESHCHPDCLIVHLQAQT